MIANLPVGKTDPYATDATTSNCGITYNSAPEVLVIVTDHSDEQPPKKPAAQTAQRYIDHLWPVVALNECVCQSPGIEEPRPRQKASSYG